MTRTPQPDKGVRDKIQDIIAPNVHIGHQNIRPHTISFTEVGVERATSELTELLNSEINRVIDELETEIKKGTPDYTKLDVRNKGELNGYTQAVKEIIPLIQAKRREHGDSK